MGVPKAFSWITKNLKKKNILTSFPEKGIDNLYIDSNCLFHPMCFIVLGFFPQYDNQDKLEEKMMGRILNYLQYVIDVVGPKKQIMISVDGVAPQAKSTQQRYRRFSTIPDISEREEILNQCMITPPKRWYNTVITPGTEFMEKLHKKLLEYAEKLQKQKKIKVIYSSYHTPGEGEHKIMEDIRKKSLDSKFDNESFCIYGLDADLIYLAIASQRKHMYLLREATVFGKPKVNIDYENDDPVTDVNQELMYASIDAIRKGIYEYVLSRSATKDLNKKISLEQVCNDYTFFCYFMGNDFVPHIPSLDFTTRGLDEIFKIYISLLDKYGGEPLVDSYKDNYTVNPIFLDEIFEYFAKREDKYFKVYLPTAIKHIRENSSNPNPPGTHKYKLWDLENMIGIEYDDPVKLGEGTHEEYKSRYYRHYFCVDYSNKRQVDKICYEYLKALRWIQLYYFDSCKSFSWKYPYQVAPFITDLYDYCKREKMENITFKDYKFEQGDILTPCQQLLSVLPRDFSRYLPKSYQPLFGSSADLQLIEYYPSDYTKDYINKLVHFKCYPRIPQIEVQTILDATSKRKLTKEESKRNKVMDDFVFQ